jgi:hypothetical protein
MDKLLQALAIHRPDQALSNVTAMAVRTQQFLAVWRPFPVAQFGH